MVVQPLSYRVDVAELSTQSYLVSASGDLSGDAAGCLRDKLLPLAGADGSVLELDVGSAHTVDDGVFSVIASVAHLVRRRGEWLTVVSRDPRLRKRVVDCGLIDIVRLNRSIGETPAGG